MMDVYVSMYRVSGKNNKVLMVSSIRRFLVPYNIRMVLLLESFVQDVEASGSNGFRRATTAQLVSLNNEPLLSYPSSSWHKPLLYKRRNKKRKITKKKKTKDHENATCKI
jgi:hypothetical protein